MIGWLLRLLIVAGLLAIAPVFPPMIVVVFLVAFTFCPRTARAATTS